MALIRITDEQAQQLAVRLGFETGRFYVLRDSVQLCMATLGVSFVSFTMTEDGELDLYNSESGYADADLKTAILFYFSTLGRMP
ncbi:hypothetical protein [Larkinella soli]|uniref:hypothetical protein n=1 Tax=Larkinella soli TaxID=1770527 RepID=UPI000FFBEEBB|nr:hypothetical protein [Larkinella soli]